MVNYKERHFTSSAATLLLVLLIFALGVPSHIEHTPETCDAEHHALPLEAQEDIARAHQEASNAPAATARSLAGVQYREIETVVVLPTEFGLDPSTGISNGKTEEELQAEVQSILAETNQYLEELNLKIRVVEFQTFGSSAEDPYFVATERGDANMVLNTATSRWASYQTQDYDLVLVLGRGYYRGKFGLAYTGTSCMSQKFSAVFATQNGTSADRQYSFPQTIAHEVGHYLGMSHEKVEEVDGKSIMWTTFVARPYGFAERSLAEAQAHAGVGQAGGDCFDFVPAAFANDSDGDGVDNEREIAEGSDPFDGGSFRRSADTEVYSMWNGFLEMDNVLELVNPSDEEKAIELSLFGIAGDLRHFQKFSLSSKEQLDIIVNQLPGFLQDSYGLLRISVNGEIDGRMSFYRHSAAPANFEFAFSLPLRNNTFGKSSVAFNTFQPSVNPGESGNAVLNWLSVVNLANEVKHFRVNSFNAEGIPLRSSTLAVPAFARIDIDGGHGFAGPSVVGLHEIIPIDDTAPYLAHLIRYGSDAAAGASVSSFDFSFPLVAERGNGRTLVAPISIVDKQENWVEIANTLTRPVLVGIEVISSNGDLLSSQETRLLGHQQLHINAAAILSASFVEDGYVRVSSSRAESLLVQSMNYYRDTEGGITSMFGSPGAEALGESIRGSYNLFLGMGNWLALTNTHQTAVEVEIRLQGGATQVVRLEPFHSRSIALHSETKLELNSASYGSIEILSSHANAISAELLRKRQGTEGIDIAMPTTIR